MDLHDDLNDRAGIDRHLAVNLFGTHAVTQAFLPLLARSQGAIVNVLSLGALASVPFSPAYAISKAAAFSMTQALRALWAGLGVKVHAVFPGPVDTDLTRSLDIPKASAESVARAILDGMDREEEDIFPDPMSENIADGWRSGVAKALERQFAATPESVAKSSRRAKWNGDSVNNDAGIFRACKKALAIGARRIESPESNAASCGVLCLCHGYACSQFIQTV